MQYDRNTTAFKDINNVLGILCYGLLASQPYEFLNFSINIVDRDKDWKLNRIENYFLSLFAVWKVSQSRLLVSKIS